MYQDLLPQIYYTICDLYKKILSLLFMLQEKIIIESHKVKTICKNIIIKFYSMITKMALSHFNDINIWIWYLSQFLSKNIHACLYIVHTYNYHILSTLLWYILKMHIYVYRLM